MKTVAVPPRRPGTWRRTCACIAVVVLAGGDIAVAQAQSPSSSETPTDCTSQLQKESTGSYSCLEVLRRSLFGKQPDPDRTWTPLTLGNLADGWCDPWVSPPSPSGGSLRQGWVNTYDAFFN